jgi:hypothetical protein
LVASLNFCQVVGCALAYESATHPIQADSIAACGTIPDRSIIASADRWMAVPRTFVAVVFAHHVFAEVLFAYTFYTNARKALEVAGHSVGQPFTRTGTRTTNAIVVGAFLVVRIVADHSVPDRSVVARAGGILAGVPGAFVVVIADDVLAEVLSAHTRYTNTGKAMKVALHSVLDRNVVARAGGRIAVPGALVPVAVAYDAFALVVIKAASL